MSDPLLLPAAWRDAGVPTGIVSVCSSHPTVIRAAARDAALSSSPFLIEATCNQVNQFGGYTGMRPADFVEVVITIARSEGLADDRIIFGGDHLGPNPWRKESAESAMSKAEDMVSAYVRAGFRKIHLDASMGCAGEPVAPDEVTVARRAVRLARKAEEAAALIGPERPVYVIGTEVPPPGGADHMIDRIEPTSLAAAQRTMEVHREIFREEGLSDAFSRAIAVVVQPGVEFGNENIVFYDRTKARHLGELLRQEVDLVFEAHSTDYQPPAALRELVEDGFAILKVGPQLTFVLREALYGLDLIASDLLPDYGARPLYTSMEELMLSDPKDWTSHYHGSAAELRVQRHYSLSDRIRYYWNHPQAVASVQRVTEALSGKSVPAALFHQHLPSLREFSGTPLIPAEVLVASVRRALAGYRFACTGGGPGDKARVGPRLCPGEPNASASVA